MRPAQIALVGGPVLALLAFVALPHEFRDPAGNLVLLSTPARGTLAFTVCMAVWWLTEALPVSATALVPVTLFPLFGLNRLEQVAAAYAHPLIFLFFGGFLLSIAIEKWRLHAWIAQRVIALAGADARRLVAGFMIVTAFASMWLSNTATAVMMLPIALSAIGAVDRAANEPAASASFSTCLLLGIAYAASIGGMATLIGSPPNLFVAGFLAERFGYELDFRTWMVVALPVVAVLLPTTWWLLTRVLAPVGPSLLIDLPGVRTPWRELPTGARRVALVFVAAVLAWMTRTALNDWTIAGVRPLGELSDTGIALAAALVLFVLPAGTGNGVRLLEWHDAEKLPIGTLLLFGGGLALAVTISATGADQFIGAQLATLHGVPGWAVLLVVVAVVIFLTELTSNIATTTTLVPILAAAALAGGLDVLGIIVVTALAASAAFMLPVATPPNAIVFASGRIPVATMARAGLILNLVAIVVIGAVGIVWMPLVLPVLAP